MGSLKHLLIDLEEDARQSFHFTTIASRSSDCPKNESHDVPLLDDPSWPALWSGFFNSDIGGAELHYDFGDLDWSQADVGIETWATHDLPVEGLLLMPADSIDSSVSLPTDTAEQVCYGMIYRAAVKLIGRLPT